MSSERSNLVEALELTYRHIENLDRIGAESDRFSFTTSAHETAQRIITAILAMDGPTLADCTPTPPVKTVSAETLRRLKASLANHKHSSVRGSRKEFIVLIAEQHHDNLMLSDLDEILAALEQRQ
jgi:hypothetical protein